MEIRELSLGKIISGSTLWGLLERSESWTPGGPTLSCIRMERGLVAVAAGVFLTVRLGPGSGELPGSLAPPGAGLFTQLAVSGFTTERSSRGERGVGQCGLGEPAGREKEGRVGTEEKGTGPGAGPAVPGRSGAGWRAGPGGRR